MKGYFLFNVLLCLISAQACKKETHAPASGVKVSGGQEVKTDFPHKNALVGLFFQYNKETAPLLFDAHLLRKDEFQEFMSRANKNPSEVGWLPLV